MWRSEHEPCGTSTRPFSSSYDPEDAVHSSSFSPLSRPAGEQVLYDVAAGEFSQASLKEDDLTSVRRVVTYRWAESRTQQLRGDHGWQRRPLPPRPHLSIPLPFSFHRYPCTTRQSPLTDPHRRTDGSVRQYRHDCRHRRRIVLSGTMNMQKMRGRIGLWIMRGNGGNTSGDGNYSTEGRPPRPG